MELSTVEIPRAGARERAAEYARAAKDPKLSDRERREFEEIARAYRVAARDNVQLIALAPTIQAGGTMIRTAVQSRWDGEQKRTVEEHINYLLPQLAVCTPHSAYCYTAGIQRDGAVEFIDALGRDFRYRRGVVDLETRFELPASFGAGATLAGSWNRPAWSAMVPIVPPKHRPERGFGQRLVLWEVDDWVRASLPAPPHDPALLRPLGGDLYAVEAVWDLTELERLVLSGRRA